MAIEEAIKFIERHITSPFHLIYEEVYEHGLKILKQFYDSNNKLNENDLATSIVLNNILNNKADIEEIQEMFGNNVAMIVFNTNDDVDDHKLRGYEKIFKDYDFIFIKLIIRVARIYVTIDNLDSNKFKKYINDHSELRRKLLNKADKNIMVLMDYESDLIKYGRNIFAGKPARSYKYKNLIMNA